MNIMLRRVIVFIIFMLIPGFKIGRFVTGYLLFLVFGKQVFLSTNISLEIWNSEVILMVCVINVVIILGGI